MGSSQDPPILPWHKAIRLPFPKPPKKNLDEIVALYAQGNASCLLEFDQDQLDDLSGRIHRVRECAPLDHEQINYFVYYCCTLANSKQTLSKKSQNAIIDLFFDYLFDDQQRLMSIKAGKREFLPLCETDKIAGLVEVVQKYDSLLHDIPKVTLYAFVSMIHDELYWRRKLHDGDKKKVLPSQIIENGAKVFRKFASLTSEPQKNKFPFQDKEENFLLFQFLNYAVCDFAEDDQWDTFFDVLTKAKGSSSYQEALITLSWAEYRTIQEKYLEVPRPLVLQGQCFQPSEIEQSITDMNTDFIRRASHLNALALKNFFQSPAYKVLCTHEIEQSSLHLLRKYLGEGNIIVEYLKQITASQALGSKEDVEKGYPLFRVNTLQPLLNIHEASSFAEVIEMASYNLTDWVLLKQIGEGGFKKVYAAYNAYSPKKTRRALKVYVPTEKGVSIILAEKGEHELQLSQAGKGQMNDTLSKEDLQKIVEAECRADYMDIVESGNPHINGIFTAFWQSNVFVTVEPLCNGGSLIDYDKRIASHEPIPYAEAITRMMQIYDGLIGLRDLGISHHGDLKFQNVLVHVEKDGKPTLKLTDFGQSPTLSRIARISSYANVGYPATMAPELLCSDQVPTFQSDLWSLGILFDYMLTGSYLVDFHQPENWKDISLLERQKVFDSAFKQELEQLGESGIQARLESRIAHLQATKQEKDTARALLYDLLHMNPSLRRMHEYIVM